MTDQPRRKGAVFFDLDRTIISGSSVFALGWAAYRAGMVTNRELVADAASAATFLVAGASDEKTDAVKDRILQAIDGLTVEAMSELGAQIMPRLESEVRREARGLIDLHHAAAPDRRRGQRVLPVELPESERARQGWLPEGQGQDPQPRARGASEAGISLR